MAGAFKNILVPFDNSSHSQKALRIARTLARSFDATLHVATVVDISSVAPPGLIRSEEKKALESIRSSIKQSAKERIRKIEEECSQEEVATKGWVIEGSTASELLKLIKGNSIDLVVIGSMGLSGLSRLKALGSVSRKISELSDCPVMIIR
ncbi:MAG TPA: universal stress protein [Candidatus Nitrosotalea sp.]|nr:universal stress protein [Candidatus Nitrosotalea sp.]